jgi:3-deoxy-7-phosphoheptulonate synthase
MLILMTRDSTPSQLDALLRMLERWGLEGRPVWIGERFAVSARTGAVPVDPTPLRGLPGVSRVIELETRFPLAHRRARPGDTVVRVGPVRIGGGESVFIAGPCAVESEQQILEVAREVQGAGAHLLRGGAYKPRTSPYSFQGLGELGLKLLARARAETGLPVVTEAVDEPSVELVEQYADMIQVGARNMQNFSLLRRVGRSPLPVLLKRGMSAGLDDLLLAAEHVLREGNSNVVLCERGIRTFSDHTRYTLDLSIVPAVKELAHLPIVVDPSHGTGARLYVMPMARAAIAAGADGVMVEVHAHPEQALCDGPQALRPVEFASLVAELRALASRIPGRAETLK